MATKTTNYNLTKPSGSENADIDVINANMDIIDGALSGKASTSVATTSANGLMSSTDKTKLEGITAGAQPNVIETVKVNNSAVSVSDKAVNIDLSGYALKSDISSVYKVKGSVGSVSGLPSNASIGDVYNVTADGSNYVWTGSEWDALGGTVDLSSYAKRSDIPDVSGYLPKSGGTMGGTLNTVENLLAINFRPTVESMRSGISYKTNGDEAVCFENRASVTSWIFRTHDSVLNPTSAWDYLTPSFQIKNQCVAVNKLIPNGANGDYNLDVNGTANATTIYQNGKQVANKEDVPKITVSTTDIGEGSSLTTGTLYLVYE